MDRNVLLTAVVAGGVLVGGGCRHKCCHKTSVAPRPYLPPAPSVGPGGSVLIPPAGVPVAPPPGGQLPAPDLGPPPGLPSGPPSTSGRPAPEILLPDPVPGGRSSRSDSPTTPPARPPSVTLEPPLAVTPAVDGTAGLPGFVRVKDGVASGRKPALDGFDTLKRTGFKSIVYLHAPGADVAALRDVAEKKGLTFTAIETTPEKLPDAMAAFDRVLADRTGQPVYVADDTGVRAGALWYVYLRTNEQLSPEVARIRARGLGMTDDTDEGRAFWVAIQQHLGR